MHKVHKNSPKEMREIKNPMTLREKIGAIYAIKLWYSTKIKLVNPKKCNCIQKFPALNNYAKNT